MTRHTCKCGKSFARSEHLRRHEKCHVPKRPFQCIHCPKSFVRKDVFRRHQQLHTSPTSCETPLSLSESPYACSNCALAKVKCDKRQPCSRCTSKRQQCVPRRQGPDPSPPSRSTSAAPVRKSSRTPQDQEDVVAVAGMFESTPLPSDPPADDGQALHPWNFDELSNVNWLPPETSQFTYEDLLTPTSSIPFDFSVLFDDPMNSQMWPELMDPSISTTDATTPSRPYIDTSPALTKALSCQMPSRFSLGRHPESNNLIAKAVNATGPLFQHPRYTIQPELEGKRYSLAYSEGALPSSDVSPPPPHFLNDAHYADIVEAYSKLSLNVHSIFPVFEVAPPPSRAVANECIRLYRQHFHPGFPFIHTATDLGPDSHWTLVLAIIAIGSQFLRGEQSDIFSVSMQELLRRVLVDMEESNVYERGIEVELLETKIRLLHAVGAGYLGHRTLFRSAMRSMGDLVTWVRSRWTPKTFETLDNLPARTVDEKWTLWRFREQKLRLGYGIWLIDAMWNFQHHRPPTLTLEDASEMPLPCDEALWDASTVSEWSYILPSAPHPGILVEAVRQLYVDKSSPAHLGYFSVVLLTLGICHQTWGLARHVRQCLSRFEPSAARQDKADVQAQFSVWPPSVPIFNKWRNAACDCLDILQSSWMNRPPTATRDLALLHLHQARVVLLAPLSNIIRLASYLAGNNRGTPLAANSADAAEDRRLIQSWAKQDHFKARAAATHAGAIFSQVRQMNQNSFYEPPAVALAALVLWAYSIFSGSVERYGGGVLASRSVDPSLTAEDNSTDEESASTDTGNVVMLDRPTDKELIEQFIRRAGRVDAYLSGVGDIRNPRAPEKTLAQARKLLDRMNAWRACSEGWIYLLDNLMRVTKKVRRTQSNLEKHSLVKGL